MSTHIIAHVILAPTPGRKAWAGSWYLLILRGSTLYWRFCATLYSSKRKSGSKQHFSNQIDGIGTEHKYQTTFMKVPSFWFDNEHLIGTKPFMGNVICHTRVDGILIISLLHQWFGGTQSRHQPPKNHSNCAYINWFITPLWWIHFSNPTNCCLTGGYNPMNSIIVASLADTDSEPAQCDSVHLARK